ncbi:MAG: MarR family transcriptional regulator [Rhizobiaceae bacterium]|nr:MAG: MarR family transcriptional regulator [Rhizobiaceae bacterium]
MSHTIGFLISDVSRLMRKRFDERARLIGATRAQWKTLVTLSRNEGINQGGLADLLEVEPITLTRMIDRLEEAGYVERRRDPADRRAWRIHLTDAAKPVLEKLGTYADDLFELSLAGLDDRQRVALLAALDTIRSNLAPDFPKEAANG